MMTGLRTITATEMRVINRSAILELIRRESPISRTAIAKRLDVSLPTVMRIVDQLVDEGLVHPDGSSEWSGGRRRALLAFNADGHVVVGVDLGALNMLGAIANLGGKILHEADIQRHTSSGEENFQNLVKLIEVLLANPKLEGRKIWGIGVGAPAVTTHQDGIITWAHSLNWREYPLKAKLAEHFNLPIIVDNDLNLAVLGEYWFGAGQNARNIVLLSVGTGIGAGIIIDGALYRGAHEASGEVCNIIPGREFLGKSLKEFGALESLASCIGIIHRAKQGLKDRLTPVDLETLNVGNVFTAAQKGEDWARNVFNETVDYLAIGVANIMSCFDPDLIILGGEIVQYADQIIEPLLKRIEDALPIQPCLIASSLGSHAVVMGAIANVLHNTSDFYVVQKLS
jgi:predicted NBD/HSP70 family sugar kinase